MRPRYLTVSHHRHSVAAFFTVVVVAVAVAVVVVVATAAVKSKRRPELKQINSDSPPNYGASF